MFRILFTYLPFGAFVLLMLGFVFPSCRALGMRTRAQAVWAIVLLAACSKFLCYRAFGGDEFNPDLPLWLIWAWNWFYSGAMILLVLTAALFFLPGKVKPFLLPALAWTLSAWGVWNGVKVPSVREVEVSVPALPDALDGYRILQLADIHVSSAALRGRTAAIVERANQAAADLVVCTGDIVDGPPALRWRDVEPLTALKARDGVWFSTGNHEFYGDWAGWRRQYEAWGFKFLHGESVVPRAGLALGGLDDPACALAGMERRAAGRSVFASATNGEFRVLLDHRPGDFAANASGPDGAALQLSGHTHGGVMPLLGRLVAKANAGYVRGLYASGDRRLFVSPGCGQWAGFPLRFFNDPEINVLVLKKDNDR